MSLASQYLLYLTAFRLGIITAAIVSIVLGYRLFVAGVQLDGRPEKESSLQAKVAGLGFTLKNAAPGTGFGFFGVILITVMLVQGTPEFVYRAVKNNSGVDTTATPTEIRMRSGETADRFATLVEKGVSYERAGNAVEAVDAYREALSSTTKPLNQIAWLYLQQGKVDEALPFARVAADLDPNNADVLDTLAEILAKSGNKTEAEQWMARAAALDPRYREKLSSLRREGQSSTR